MLLCAWALTSTGTPLRDEVSRSGEPGSLWHLFWLATRRGDPKLGM